jgi:hypothetical protein
MEKEEVKSYFLLFNFPSYFSLTERGIGLIKTEFEDGLRERGEKLKKSQDPKDFERFNETCKAFKESLSEKVIAW